MNTNEKILLLTQKPKTSHLLHLVLSVVSAGFWVPVWLIIGMINQQKCANIDRRIKRNA